jgi:AcrR family transcriptional regulator
MTEQHGDTRTRIQQVAFELFATQGYEKTSLREVAEQLGVTKAALYYHFKTKEEIVQSTVEDYLRSLDELIAWGQEQPRTLATRQELIRRYADLVVAGGRSMRFFHQNPAHGAKLGEEFRARMHHLLQLMVDEDAELTAKIRAILALFGQAMSVMMTTSEDSRLPGGPYEPDEVRKAAVEVALELLEPRP